MHRIRPMSRFKHHVLFLCTGNSCRSQMAEGFANFLGAGDVEARSAGLKAHGRNPRAIAVMSESGVDISRQASKEIAPELLDWADIVVTVCGHADEHCPTVSAQVHKLHWPIPDPAKAAGPDDETMKVFRAVRDDIHRRVDDLIASLRRERNGV